MAARRRKDIFTNHDRLNQSVTEVFVEQPLASPGSANYTMYILGLDSGINSGHFEELFGILCPLVVLRVIRNS